MSSDEQIARELAAQALLGFSANAVRFAEDSAPRRASEDDPRPLSGEQPQRVRLSAGEERPRSRPASGEVRPAARPVSASFLSMYPSAGSSMRPTYSEGIGRFTDPSVERRRPLPVDRRTIGYLPITPESHPEYFRDEEAEGARALVDAAEAGYEGDDMVSQADLDEMSDDEPEAWEMPNPWRKNQPQPQPLSYNLPTADGGQEQKFINFRVDFSDGQSVSTANKARRCAIARRQKAQGKTTLLRPSTQGLEYTQQHTDWMRDEFARYGAANDGKRMSMPELADRFNARFPGQDRGASGIASYVDRRLGHVKALYPL
ncbi:hypothetical protein LTR53_008947 [Teratosphaeriaceae sp. CCFEE 6253]|nr:hypothetical protein LTR53_008947 [Teratosphaeriaceae sp. CCFEE 6253]